MQNQHALWFIYERRMYFFHSFARTRNHPVRNETYNLFLVC